MLDYFRRKCVELNDAIPTLETLGVACAAAFAAEQSAYDFSVIQYGKERDLTDFKNEVVVVVNVASE